MKVVAIEGSPHRGNTSRRVEEFGRALVSLGDVEFQHLALRDADLRPCRGCYRCFSTGEDACPLGDDKAAIERLLAEADAVVFASPVYAMHISSLLKGFVDRLAYTFHRPRYFGAYAIGLAVTGGTGLKEALEYIRGFAGAWGFEYVSDLRYVDVPRNSNLPSLMTEKDRTEEVAGKLHHLMSTRPERRLTRNDYLHFYALRTVYGRMEAYAPTDYEYWRARGWLDRDARYFTDHARVSTVRSLYPRFLAWLMARGMDRQLAKLAPGGSGNENDHEEVSHDTR
jgi:multimeric flavodoxin WrbA